MENEKQDEQTLDQKVAKFERIFDGVNVKRWIEFSLPYFEIFTDIHRGPLKDIKFIETTKEFVGLLVYDVGVYSESGSDKYNKPISWDYRNNELNGVEYSKNKNTGKTKKEDIYDYRLERKLKRYK